MGNWGSWSGWQEMALPWAGVLADLALKGTALLAFGGLLALAARRATAAARHLIWTATIVGLLLVPVLAVVLPAWRVLPEWATTAPREAAVVAPPSLARPVEAPVMPVAGPVRPVSAGDVVPPGYAEVSVGKAVAPVVEPAVAEPEAVRGAMWPGVLVLIWAAGAVVAAVPLVVSPWLLGRVQRKASVVREGLWVRLCDVLRVVLRLGRKVALLKTGERSVPMTFGVVRPKILLPAEAEGWSADRKRVVLLHELAHIKRHDCLTLLLARVARCVFWFHPLVWVACARLSVERERACDDMVLRAGTRSSDYASELLSIASTFQANQPGSYAALAMARPSTLEGRLLAILDAKRNRRKLAMTTAGLIVVLVAGVMVPLACMKARSESARKPTELTLGDDSEHRYLHIDAGARLSVGPVKQTFGKVYKIYLYGNFDLDGDGVASPAERARIVQIIRASGCEVVDKVDSQTDYFILGALPAIESAADLDAARKAQKDEYIRLLVAAKDYAVPVLAGESLFSEGWSNTIDGLRLRLVMMKQENGKGLLTPEAFGQGMAATEFARVELWNGSDKAILIGEQNSSGGRRSAAGDWLVGLRLVAFDGKRAVQFARADDGPEHYWSVMGNSPGAVEIKAGEKKAFGIRLRELVDEKGNKLDDMRGSYELRPNLNTTGGECPEVWHGEVSGPGVAVEIKEKAGARAAGPVDLTGYAVTVKPPKLEVVHAKAGKEFAALVRGEMDPAVFKDAGGNYYVQYDGLGASTLHYYGPMTEGEAMKLEGRMRAYVPVAAPAKDDIVAAVKKGLPEGWSVLRERGNASPTNQPAGKGTGLFLVKKGVPTGGMVDYNAAVFVMPADYVDGGDDPTHGEVMQTSPAKLVGSTPEGKIYLWGGDDGLRAGLKKLVAGGAATEPKLNGAAPAGALGVSAEAVKEIAGRLESKDFVVMTGAITDAYKLVQAQPVGADMGVFGPLVEPLFAQANMGGIGREDGMLAAEVVVRIGQPAIGLLKTKLKSQGYHDRWSAMKILSDIGEPKAQVLSSARGLLKDSDHFVRTEAIKALGKLGREAKDAIGDLEAEADDPYEPNQVLVQGALIQIEGVSDRRVKAIASHLKSQDANSAAFTAAAVLDAMGSPALVVLPELMEAVHSADANVRAQATHAIGQTRTSDATAIAILIDRLKNDTDLEVRRSAAGSLGEIGSAAGAALPALREVVAKAKENEGWWVAEEAIGRISPQHIDHVVIDARADGTLSADVFLEGFPTPQTRPWWVQAQILDNAGKSVGEPFPAPSRFDNSNFTRLSSKVAAPHVWTAEAPYLYQLEVRVGVGPTVMHSQRARFGFGAPAAREGAGPAATATRPASQPGARGAGVKIDVHDGNVRIATPGAVLEAKSIEVALAAPGRVALAGPEVAGDRLADDLRAAVAVEEKGLAEAKERQARGLISASEVAQQEIKVLEAQIQLDGHLWPVPQADDAVSKDLAALFEVQEKELARKVALQKVGVAAEAEVSAQQAAMLETRLRQENRAKAAAATGEFYIMGQIQRPGVYSLTGRKINLLQAIAAAGGDATKPEGIVVTLIHRIEGGKERTTHVPLATLVEDRSQDVILTANDIVMVSKSERVGTLLAEKEAAETKLAEVAGTLGAANPEVVRLKAELERVNAELAKELASTTTKAPAAPATAPVKTAMGKVFNVIRETDFGASGGTYDFPDKEMSILQALAFAGQEIQGIKWDDDTVITLNRPQEGGKFQSRYFLLAGLIKDHSTDMLVQMGDIIHVWKNHQLAALVLGKARLEEALKQKEAEGEPAKLGAEALRKQINAAEAEIERVAALPLATAPATGPAGR